MIGIWLVKGTVYTTQNEGYIKELKYKIDIDATHYLICNAINRITFRTPSLHSPLAILYYITPTAEKSELEQRITK